MMKPTTKTILIAALVVGAVGLSAAGIAYAQGDFPHPKGALAELLGLEPEELREQIQAGTTIEELADEAGVDLEEFRQEMMAKRQEDMQTRIEEALADGEISKDQADWLLEGLEKGYLDGPFFKKGGRGGGQPGFDGEGMRGMRSKKSSPDQ
jgi:hypothetical protein